jgi:hypothetical protein
VLYGRNKKTIEGEREMSFTTNANMLYYNHHCQKNKKEKEKRYVTIKILFSRFIKIKRKTNVFYFYVKEDNK